jgi:FtsP/CotA-like multicopper oxidase with cupredoxin domain
MVKRKLHQVLLLSTLACLVSVAASAQSFRVQCPTATALHPAAGPSNGAIKCQQISGGDGYATMANGNQIFMFSFGPLSGLTDISQGHPGTQLNSVFNVPYDPSATSGAAMNGAVGLALDAASGAVIDPLTGTVTGNTCVATATYTPPASCYTGHVDPRQIMDVGVMNGNQPGPMMAIDEDDEFFLTLTNVGMLMRPDLFEQHTVHFHGYPNASSFYDGVPDASVAVNIGGSFSYYYLAPDAGTYFWHCHIAPPEHLQMGMVGQLYVRPRQNRVASGASLYAGLVAQQADLRTASNCNADILCPSPLPASNNLATHGNNKSGTPTLYAYNDGDGSTRYDVEYPLQIHGFDPSFHFVGMTFNPEGFVDMKDKYFLLNGRSYPDTIETTGYVDPGAASGVTNFSGAPAVSPAFYTQDSDGVARPSQPLNAAIKIPAGGRALLRISDLDVTEYQTLASLGIPMQVVGQNARLLRDEAGNNMSYTTNSITLAGGESIDVILDATDTTKYPSGSTFYLYTPQLDHLANDAENFGGLMTEVTIQ